MVTVTFDDEERRLLVDVIDIHVAGTQAARELTTDDPTIESAEQLLDLISGYDEQLGMLASIRSRLNG